MSEYHVAKVVFTDANVLKTSLEDMGFKVSVHQKPVSIEGYNGSRVGSAHLVVSSNQFGGYGDVGFEETEDGFRIHADWDDLQGDEGARFQLPVLNQKYIENKLKKHAANKSDTSVTSVKKKDNGQTELHLKINQ